MRIGSILVLWLVLTGLHYGQASVVAEGSAEARPVHLPALCKKYYNDGTGRWAECMGVGPK